MGSVESGSRAARTVAYRSRAEFEAEDGNGLTGIYPMTKVVVERGGRVLHQKNVLPFFSSIRSGTGIYLPKPLYEKRVKGAIKKADKIAEKYNIGKLPRERKLYK